MELKADVKLTPEQVAEAIWNLNGDEQAEMFNHLYNIAGGSYLLMMQFMYVRDACKERKDNSLDAFQYMFSSAYKYMR